MIEVKNLCKTYRPKKGVPVKALDNVSLKFDDTGMVFILGKSGSGKSTLLNVLGGLDSYDSGEFIVQGKSSNDFSQGDFDAYRNTLIGFIFQEYNILNDFSVGANIALAMQLQGKKVTNETLNEILEQVDLVGFANRKPNELSGGQKQRVAIARALIKEPRIIMADEPTGALDSNTGKQVFDTLKKLSKTKLVIVVSHDREFAEYYGDRVIELADGKIISDISKYTAHSEEKTDGISVIDNKILHIKKGYKLTQNDLELINEYLEKTQNDTIISTDEKSNKSFKQLAMIDDSGNKQSFKDTSEMPTKPETEKEKIKLIKSRMPYKNSLKMGASGLKHKKFRLAVTIILCVISFALFGLADTFASYDAVKVNTQSLIDSGISTTNIVKTKKRKNGDYVYYDESFANKDDLATLKTQTGLNVYGILNLENFYLGNFCKTQLTGIYYNEASYINGAISLAEKDIEAFGTLEGRMPQNRNEIVITKLAYEVFAKAGYRNYVTDEEYESSEIDTPQKFLEKNIVLYSESGFLEDEKLVVVGILDTGINKNGEYDPLKDINSPNGSTNKLYYDYTNELDSSIHRNIILSKQLNDEIVEKPTLGLKTQGNGYYYNFTGMHFEKMFSLSELKNMVATTFKGDKLQDNEILIPYNRFVEQVSGQNIALKQTFKYKTLDWRSLELVDYEANYFDEIANKNDYFYYEIINKYDITFTQQEIDKAKNAIRDEGIDNVDSASTNVIMAYYYIHIAYNEVPVKISSKVKQYLFDMIDLNYVLQQATFTETTYEYNDYNNDENSVGITELVVAGVFDDTMFKQNEYNVIISDKIINLAKEYKDSGYYVKMIALLNGDNDGIEKLVKMSVGADEDSQYKFALKNAVSDILSDFGSMIEMVAEIFVYVGLALAFFSCLLLMNFISTSISYKKREIGILRAVGAKSSDVFGIFFNESAIISGINLVLSVIATIGVCIGLNFYIAKQLGVSLTLLIFGIRQIGLMVAISVLVAFLGSFLPVYNIARKRPIDAIQNR